MTTNMAVETLNEFQERLESGVTWAYGEHDAGRLTAQQVARIERWATSVTLAFVAHSVALVVQEDN